MTTLNRVLFWLLRLLDQLLPGWSQPAEPQADYLSSESYKFWLTRHGRSGQP